VKLAVALLMLVAAAPAAAQGRSSMAHDRAPRSIVGVEPNVGIYGGLYSGIFTNVVGVWCDRVSGEVYVADSGANAIEIFDEKGAPLFAFTDEHLQEPFRIAVDPRGRIHVIDSERSRIKIFNYRGEFVEYLKLPGFDDGTQIFTAIAFDANGDLYVGESRSGQVLVFRPDLRLKVRVGTFGEDKGQLSGIAGIAFDAEHIYVSSQDGVAVHVFSKYGRLLRAWGYHDAGLHNVSLPAGIAVDAKGRVILLDTLRQEIKYFDVDGRLIDMFGGLGPEPGAVSYPTDLSMDRNGRLCVADRGNTRVQILTPVEAPPPPPEEEDGDVERPADENAPAAPGPAPTDSPEPPPVVGDVAAATPAQPAAPAAPEAPPKTERPRNIGMGSQ
jgi:hypothetical protein